MGQRPAKIPLDNNDRGTEKAAPRSGVIAMLVIVLASCWPIVTDTRSVTFSYWLRANKRPRASRRHVALAALRPGVDDIVDQELLLQRCGASVDDAADQTHTERGIRPHVAATGRAGDGAGEDAVEHRPQRGAGRTRKGA